MQSTKAMNALKDITGETTNEAVIERVKAMNGNDNARLTTRLEQLRAEYQSGVQQKAQLEQQLTKLTTTLLRIEGAIQVLAEETGEVQREAQEEKPE